MIQLHFPKRGAETRVIVEAAHIYTNRKIGLEHIVGAELGSRIALCLESLGASVDKWAFIDDYTPLFEEESSQLDLGIYFQTLAERGFAPDNTIYESELVKQAEDLCEHLQKKGYAGKNHKGEIILYKDGILLFDPEKNKYACSLLDASLYTQKLSQADYCVTVLDQGQGYMSQQKKTRIVLKKLGVDTSNVFNYFYTTPKNDAPSGDKEHTPFVQPTLDLVQAISMLSGDIK